MPDFPPARNSRFRQFYTVALALCATAGLMWWASAGPATNAQEPIAAPLPRVIDQPLDHLDEVLAVPADWRPWWDQIATATLLDRPSRLEMTADGVVFGALTHSAHIKVLRDVPAIQETVVAEACSQFDWRSFMETKFLDTSDPVGSTLTTGGPPRYLDQNWNYSAGVRRLGETGARLEAAQRFGYEDSNSVFFVPDQQGTARMSLSLTQPLLNGAGRWYNTSAIVLARIDTAVAQDKVARDLQNVLLDVQKVYWELYRERVVLLQKRKLFQQGRQIHRELEGRRQVDVVMSQIARAKAALATRGAAVIRQEAQVLNGEAKLRTLVNDPLLSSVEIQELVPVQRPIDTPQDVALQDSLVLALANRPEIDQATRELRAGSVRLDVSTAELMPVLNLILSSYVSGLEGDADIGGAWEDQFASGRPTYSAGVLFEYPLGNRGAQARLRRRRLELRQLTNQLEVTTANVRLEVETAVREIATARREMMSHYHAIVSGEAEIEYLERRWRLLPGDQQAAGIVLDDLLNAQERLSRAEASYVGALAGYNIALVQLKRATGTLLQMQALPVGVPVTVAKPATFAGAPKEAARPPVAPSTANNLSARAETVSELPPTERVVWPLKPQPSVRQ
jgi:outer membrane protein TolC